MWRKSGLLTTQFHLGNNKNVFVPEDNNKNPEKKFDICLCKQARITIKWGRKRGELTTQTTSVESKLPLDLEHQPQLVSKQYAKDSMMFSDTSHRFKVPYFVPCPSDGLVQRYMI